MNGQKKIWSRSDQMVRTSSKLSVVAVAAFMLADSALGSGTYYNLGANRGPSGVSADGSVAAGATTTGQPYFIWQLSNPGVTTLIGGVSPGNGVGGQAKVSNDGDKISGSVAGFVALPPIPMTVVNQMGVYDVSDATWTGLGGIGWYSGTETAGGWGISGDGNTVVGLGWSPNQTNAYAITSTNGGAPVALPWLVPGRSTRANGCNQDGTVVVGWQDNPFGFRQAAIWVNGVGQRLWQTYPKGPLGEASSCSADGNWVVGLQGPLTLSQAWRWSQSTGVQLLGELNPADGWNANATGISADGNTIVGYERPFGPPLGGVGFIWTQSGGMQNLTDYVVANGVTLPGGVTLALPLNVSADGRTFVGVASNSSGFVVRIDPPGDGPFCAGDANLDGHVDASDLLAVINAWGSCPANGECVSDFTNDQIVNVSDLLAVINGWGVCP
jgi:hypothetical protein